VYRDFKDVSEFKQELEQLLSGNGKDLKKKRCGNPLMRFGTGCGEAKTEYRDLSTPARDKAARLRSR
jgi:hypothetical protein